MSEWLFDNLLAWTLQVFVIGSLGALLPNLFGIRDPRSHLVYCHAVLVVCLALPFIQPWEHPVAVGDTARTAETEPSAGAVPEATAVPASSAWRPALFWVLLIGTAARFAWLGAGCWRISRYRRAATPLDPPPAAASASRKLTGADALLCTSPHVTSPVTFGFLKPVVLLPESFEPMGSKAQTAILCHELLHVRRRDWLATMLEEITASLLWFNPAVWWLLSQTRLVREQLVDTEVVELTRDCEPYIQALLAIAGNRGTLDLAPAPLFLRRRHLARRMRSLLTEVTMSTRRLGVSYASILAIVVFAGWGTLSLFPLTARAEPTTTQVQAEEGFVVRIITWDPRIAGGIEGEVVVELTFNADGKIVDSRVLSGPEELRQAALQAALRHEYSIRSNRTLQVIVEFNSDRLAPPPPPPPPPGPAPAGTEPSGAEGGRLRVSSGVSAANLVVQIHPEYPPLARAARIQGVVLLEANIDTDGNVTAARVLTGHPLLAAAAQVAVLQWKYRPTMLNGQPREVVTTVSVTFSLGPEPIE